MAVKEIESALGNKTMNDASKKGLFELLGLGEGGGMVGCLKREFYKKGEKKGDWQQKRNGGLLRTAVRRIKDGMKGKYVRLEATERSYSWTSVTGREDKMNKGGMSAEGDVCVSRKGELGGEMQGSIEYGYSERKR